MLSSQVSLGVRPVASQRRAQRPVRGVVSVRAAATLSDDVLVLSKCTPLGERRSWSHKRGAGGHLMPLHAPLAVSSCVYIIGFLCDACAF